MDMEYERETADARALDLVRNNGIAAGAVASRKDRIVGSRFRLMLRPDYRALGLDRESMRDWARQIEGEFNAWANDPTCPVDAQRKRTFTELLRDAEASRFIQGESFLSREWRLMPFSGVPFGTCFMLIEPERISDPPGVKMDNLRTGIEVDSWGAAVAYHIRTRHPADMNVPMKEAFPTWQRVTKYNRYGWLQLLHTFEQDRVSQTRGFSRFASVTKRLKMLDRHENIALELSILAASLAIVIESQFGPNSAMEALGGSSMKQLAEYVQAQGAFKNGSPVLFDGVKIPHLFPGEKLNIARAEPPGEQFQAFEESMLRHAARGLNMSYEALSGDYSKTNYSSARAAMAEAWNAVLSAREFGPSKEATLMFRLWLREGVVRGLLPLPPGVSSEDFFRREAMFARCLWIGAGRLPVDELKSAKANEVNLLNKTTTLAHIAAEAGEDWEEILEQIAEEQELKDELGIKDEAEIEAAAGAPVASDDEDEATTDV
jgi:lambda family phage portal protein